MTSWKRVSLSTILQPRKTKDIPAKFPDLPYIGMEHVARDLGTIDLLGRSAEYRSSAPKVFKGDVLYGRLRPYLNKVVIAPGEAFASGEFIVLPANDAITNKFLQYRLLSQDFVEFAGTLDTGDRPRVSWEQISKFEIDLPTLPEQLKIVEILEDHLSRLDAALADVKQAKLKAAQFRRSLLQAAFTGNLTGDATRLMTELPDGWAYKTLGEIAKWGSGGTPRAGTKTYYDGEIPWAIIGDLNDSYVSKTARNITKKGLEESSARMVPVGAVLIAMYGSIGKLGINTIPMATNQAIAFAIPNADLVLQKYLFHYLSSQREVFLWSGKGATQQNISQTLLKAWKIPLPPLPEQQKIVEILEDHLSRLDASVAIADAMEKQSSSLRRSLLQAAFTGQLTNEVASV